MIDFSGVKEITIPEGKVAKISLGNTVLWEKGPSYTDLVPTALYKDGTVFDGIGYRRGYTWSAASLQSASAFTAVGFIPIDGSVSHDIYVYGLNFTGTTYNRYGVNTETFGNLAQSVSIKAGYSDTYIKSITKLADNYFKITTATYSSKVKYFNLAGVTISGVVPIVTIDEPIM